MRAKKTSTFNRMMAASVASAQAAPGHVGPIAHTKAERLALIRKRHRRLHPNPRAYAAAIIGGLVATRGGNDLA